MKDRRGATGPGGDLSTYTQIAIVLGGGLTVDGQPAPSTVARADAAARLAKERPVAVIVSGSHGDGPAPDITEAEYMARHIAKRVPAARIFLEDESRDTATNAAYVAERYLADLEPRRLIIVTSPFHMARSLATFARVLGPSWPLEGYESDAVADDTERAATEVLYLERTRALLEGIEPGDLSRIATRARDTLHERISDAPRR